LISYFPYFFQPPITLGVPVGSGSPIQSFAVCQPANYDGLSEPAFCFVRDNTTSCLGPQLQAPCQLEGMVSSVTCGWTTACALLTTSTPYCWSTVIPGSNIVPAGLSSFASQMPTQSPVGGLAPAGSYFSSRTGTVVRCPAGTYSNG
jgi:hypothetical protein